MQLGSSTYKSRDDIKVRVAHLVSHPIQYFAPLYRALTQNSVDLTVFFNAGASLGEYFDQGFDRRINWNLSLTDGYRYVLSSGARKRPPPGGFDWRLDLSTMRSLVRENYHAIWLHGYSSINALLAILLGSITRTPVLLRDDATLLNPRSLLKKAIKRLILPILFRNVIALHVGHNNKEFFQYYGVRQTYPFSYAVDNHRWQAAHNALRGRERNSKALFGIVDDFPVVLFCGKLISKKGPLLLLSAFEELRKTIKCHLLFAGDGELRGAIEKKIQDNSIPDVHISGFLNQRDLAHAYISSDLLVLPSLHDETWGLVVNEAMNFGLPIVVSTCVGCAIDLVRDGSNGFVVEAGNVPALADAMRALLTSQLRRETFGENSRQLIAQHGLERSVHQLTSALKTVVNRPLDQANHSPAS